MGDWEDPDPGFMDRLDASFQRVDAFLACVYGRPLRLPHGSAVGTIAGFERSESLTECLDSMELQMMGISGQTDKPSG